MSYEAALPFVTGGAALGGNLLSSAFGLYAANKQMGFQERMSNTSHQREVQDLRKAGLNPILSARLGGSSTPPGSAAPTPDFASSARSALEAAQVKSAIKLQDSQARNLDVQSLDTTATQASRIDGLLASAHAQLESGNLSAAQKDMVRGQIKSLDLQRRLLGSQVRLSENSEAESSASSKFFKGKFGESAMVKKHIGTMPGYISSAKAAAESLGNRYRRWESNRSNRRREMERNHPPPGGGQW